jgi:hypothetical protein
MKKEKLKIIKEKEIKIGDLSFDKELCKEFGFTILEQNLTKEELLRYGYGFYRAKFTSNNILLALSLTFNLVFIFLCLIFIYYNIFLILR